MLEINFYDLHTVEDCELTRVVCVCTYQGKFIYARKKEKQTYEIPGGHIENGENWMEAIKRELYEEIGAKEAKIEPMCLYKISTYGLLCYAEVSKLEKIPEGYEMDAIGLFDKEPDLNVLTYPESHHLFFEKVKQLRKEKK